jgi:hypothetical protein
MGAAGSFETAEPIYQTTLRDIPEDFNLSKNFVL